MSRSTSYSVTMSSIFRMILSSCSMRLITALRTVSSITGSSTRSSIEWVTLQREKSVLTQRSWIFRTRRFPKGIGLVMDVMIFGIPENAVVICVE